METNPFPDEMHVTLVDDVFTNYTIGVFMEEKVLVYCETCDGVVAVFEENETHDLSWDELYELIIQEHRKFIDIFDV